jgi:hypothetical protein
MTIFLSLPLQRTGIFASGVHLTVFNKSEKPVPIHHYIPIYIYIYIYISLAIGVPVYISIRVK